MAPRETARTAALVSSKVIKDPFFIMATLSGELPFFHPPHCLGDGVNVRKLKH
jgi:hypothetical protein